MPAPLPVGSVPTRGGSWALLFSTEPCRMKSGPLEKSGELISSPGQGPNQPAMPWESQAPSLGLGFLIHDTRVWIAEKSGEEVWRTKTQLGPVFGQWKGHQPGTLASQVPAGCGCFPRQSPISWGLSSLICIGKGVNHSCSDMAKGPRHQMGTGVWRGCVGRKVVQVGLGLLGLVSTLF